MPIGIRRQYTTMNEQYLLETTVVTVAGAAGNKSNTSVGRRELLVSPDNGAGAGEDALLPSH